MRDIHGRIARFTVSTLIFVLGLSLLALGTQQETSLESTFETPPADGLPDTVISSDCSFLTRPLDYLRDQELAYAMRSDFTARIAMLTGDAVDLAASTVDPNTILRKNFVDDHIFSRMADAGIASAPLAADAEYLRRVYLDLTGRIPSATEVDRFLADPDPGKRDALVDSLIGTPEFVDRWTMFFGDLFRVNGPASNVNRYPQGRDAFYLYVRDAISVNKPYDQIARELITASGDTFVYGAANWPVGNIVPMGPAQDTYDGAAVNLATMFMGVNAVDCLLCHNGAGRLDQVNLWGAGQTRRNMWGLSAFFARTRLQREVVSVNPTIAKFIVSDLALGGYRLNTTAGNRSPRQPIDGMNVVPPSNPFAPAAGPEGYDPRILEGETYRQAIARQITADLQFSRAAVNYVWEKFMVEAFVSPSNSFDLARLDAYNPPPAPWELQPTNPLLLDQMARWFQQNRYDLRALMALIAKSSAYQLSSTYPGTWDTRYVPYYARKFPRRLDAEEIHDAIATATNLPGNYVFQTELPPVQWAMQLPDTREPQRVPIVAGFLNAFGRGDRDLRPRRSDGSMMQALTLLNSPFVMTRIHQANQGSRVALLLSQTSDPSTIVRQLYMNTLSRPATDEEIAILAPMFEQQGVRAATESLQWILLNKLQFLFNY